MFKSRSHLADIIKDARGKIPQWKLAEIAGVNQATISNFESGKVKTLKYDVALKICHYLNIDIRNIEGYVDREGEIDFIMALNQDMYDRLLECVKTVHCTIANADIDNEHVLENYPVEQLTKLYMKEIFQNSTAFPRDVIIERLRALKTEK